MSILAGKKNCHFLFTSLDKLKFPETKARNNVAFHPDLKLTTKFKREDNENSLLKSMNNKTMLAEFFNNNNNPKKITPSLNTIKPRVKSKSKTKISNNSSTLSATLNAQHSKNKSISINKPKNNEIIFNKVENFKKISKNNTLNNLNKLYFNGNSNISKLLSAYNNKGPHSEKTPKSQKTETSTTASKRNKKINSNGSSNCSNIYNNSNIIENELPKRKKNSFIPKDVYNLTQCNTNKDIFSIELRKNLKKKKLRLKNYSLDYKCKKFLNEENKSLISEDSAFNNDSSQKHSSKNSNTNTGSYKSKSISVDFTYSDDEITSNRKNCHKMLNKALMDHKKEEKLKFEDFCNEMNIKLFGNIGKDK